MRNIVFLHPDLGVGGAERLVVDAAIGLRQNGYRVSFVTSHHDESHCFEETKDGTLPVTVVGNWLPRQVFGKFYALCAYIRMIYCAFYVLLFLKPDVVFCDLVSVCIPILRLSSGKVIFYCHFPDQLLSKEGSLLKSLYRAPLNWLEEITTGFAHKIFVNSRFTRDVFKDTFRSIGRTPSILYPSICTEYFDKISEYSLDFLQPPLPKSAFTFLSINRYERKKNVELAIFALNKLRLKVAQNVWSDVRLIIAGGYDNRVEENKEYYQELTKIASDLEISDKIYFLKSPSNPQKVALLKSCGCVLYTPPDEHFGIVPLEAMYCAKPVIAVNSGGPTETVVNDETGYLCEMDEDKFSKAMIKIMENEDLRKKMGKAGQYRFSDEFSFQAFSSNIYQTVRELTT